MGICTNHEKMVIQKIWPILFGRLTTSVSEKRLLREDSPTNNSIPSLLLLDNKPGEISSEIFSTIPIFWIQ
jgi:uncharacterized protein (UPF0218 family)